MLKPNPAVSDLVSGLKIPKAVLNRLSDTRESILYAYGALTGQGKEFQESIRHYYLETEGRSILGNDQQYKKLGIFNYAVSHNPIGYFSELIFGTIDDLIKESHDQAIYRIYCLTKSRVTPEEFEQIKSKNEFFKWERRVVLLGGQLLCGSLMMGAGQRLRMLYSTAFSAMVLSLSDEAINNSLSEKKLERLEVFSDNVLENWAGSARFMGILSRLNHVLMYLQGVPRSAQKLAELEILSGIAVKKRVQFVKAILKGLDICDDQQDISDSLREGDRVGFENFSNHWSQGNIWELVQLTERTVGASTKLYQNVKDTNLFGRSGGYDQADNISNFTQKPSEQDVKLILPDATVVTGRYQQGQFLVNSDNGVNKLYQNLNNCEKFAGAYYDSRSRRVVLQDQSGFVEQSAEEHELVHQDQFETNSLKRIWQKLRYGTPSIFSKKARQEYFVIRETEAYLVEQKKLNEQGYQLIAEENGFKCFKPDVTQEVIPLSETEIKNVISRMSEETKIFASSIERDQIEDFVDLKEFFRRKIIKTDPFGLKIAEFNEDTYRFYYEAILKELGVDLIIIKGNQLAGLKEDTLRNFDSYYLRPEKIVWLLPVLSIEDYLQRKPEEGGFNSKERNSLRRNLKKSEGLETILEPLSEAAYQEFYKMYSQMIAQMKRGKNNLTENWFEEKKDKKRYYILKLRNPETDEIVASSILATNKKGLQVELTYTAIAENADPLAPSARLIIDALKFARKNGFLKLSYGRDYNLFGFYLSAGLAAFKLSMGFKPFPARGEAGENVIFKIISPEKFDQQTGFFSFPAEGKCNFNYWGDEKLSIAMPSWQSVAHLPTMQFLPKQTEARLLDVCARLGTEEIDAVRLKKLEEIIWQVVSFSANVEKIRLRSNVLCFDSFLGTKASISFLSSFGYLDLNVLDDFLRSAELYQQESPVSNLSEEQLAVLLTDKRLLSENIDRLADYISTFSINRSLLRDIVFRLASDTFSYQAFYKLCKASSDIKETFRMLCFAIRVVKSEDGFKMFLRNLSFIFDLNPFFQNIDNYQRVEYLFPDLDMGKSAMDYYQYLNEYFDDEDNRKNAFDLLEKLRTFLLKNPNLILGRKQTQAISTMDGAIRAWFKDLIVHPEDALEGVIKCSNIELPVIRGEFLQLVNEFLAIKKKLVKKQVTDRRTEVMNLLAESFSKHTRNTEYLESHLILAGIMPECIDFRGRAFIDIWLEIIDRAEKEDLIVVINSLYSVYEINARPHLRKEQEKRIDLVNELCISKIDSPDRLPLAKYTIATDTIFETANNLPSFDTFLSDDQRTIWLKAYADLLGCTIADWKIRTFLSAEKIILEAIKSSKLFCPNKEQYFQMFEQAALATNNFSPLIYYCAVNPDLSIQKSTALRIMQELKQSKKLFWADLLFVAEMLDGENEMADLARQILEGDFKLSYTLSDMRDECSGIVNLEKRVSQIKLSNQAKKLLISSLLNKNTSLALVLSAQLHFEDFKSQLITALKKEYSEKIHISFMDLPALKSLLAGDPDIFSLTEQTYFSGLEKANHLIYENIENGRDPTPMDGLILSVIFGSPACLELQWRPELSNKQSRLLHFFMKKKKELGMLTGKEVCIYINWLCEQCNLDQSEYDLLIDAIILLTGLPISYLNTMPLLKNKFAKQDFGKTNLYFIALENLQQVDPDNNLGLLKQIFFNKEFLDTHPWRNYGYSSALQEQIIGLVRESNLSEKNIEALVNFLFSCAGSPEHRSYAEAILLSVPAKGFSSLIKFIMFWNSLSNEMRLQYAQKRIDESRQKKALSLASGHAYQTLSAEVQKREGSLLSVSEKMREQLALLRKYKNHFLHLRNVDLVGWEEVFLANLYLDLSKDFPLEFNAEEEINNFISSCYENLENLLDHNDKKRFRTFLNANMSYLAKTGIVDSLVLYSCFANETGKIAIKKMILDLMDNSYTFFGETWRPDNIQFNGKTTAFVGHFPEFFNFLEMLGLKKESYSNFFKLWQEIWYSESVAENNNTRILSFSVTNDLERWLKHAREPVSTCQKIDRLQKYLEGNWNAEFGPDNSDGRPLRRSMLPQLKLAELRINGELVARAMIEVTLDFSQDQPKLVLLVERIYHLASIETVSLKNKFKQLAQNYARQLGISPKNIYFGDDLEYIATAKEDPNAGKYPKPLKFGERILRDIFRDK